MSVLSAPRCHLLQGRQAQVFSFKLGRWNVSGFRVCPSESFLIDLETWVWNASGLPRVSE
jgi:hypothetical protein